MTLKRLLDWLCAIGSVIAFLLITAIVELPL